VFQDGSDTTISSGSRERVARRPARRRALKLPRSQPRQMIRGYNTCKQATFPRTVSRGTQIDPDPRHLTGQRPNAHSRTETAVTPASRPQARARPLKMKRRKHWLHSLPFQQFQALFNSLFKVLFIFPSRYLFAIGLLPVFSFRWNLPPTLSCSPKQLDS
jgi:hypothetical protein